MIEPQNQIYANLCFEYSFYCIICYVNAYQTKLAVKTAGLTTNALQSSISKLSLSSYEEISPTASDLKSGTSSASQKFDFHPIGEATEVDERTLPEILTGVTEVDSPLARTSGRVSAGSTNDLLALAKNLEKKKLVRKMVFNLDSSVCISYR